MNEILILRERLENFRNVVKKMYPKKSLDRKVITHAIFLLNEKIKHTDGFYFPEVKK